MTGQPSGWRGQIFFRGAGLLAPSLALALQYKQSSEHALRLGSFYDTFLLQSS